MTSGFIHLQNVSLKDILHAGPIMYVFLINHCFWVPWFVFLKEIQEMYRQIWINLHHHSLLIWPIGTASGYDESKNSSITIAETDIGLVCYHIYRMQPDHQLSTSVPQGRFDNPMEMTGSSYGFSAQTFE